MLPCNRPKTLRRSGESLCATSYPVPVHGSLAAQLFPGDVVCLERSPLTEGVAIDPFEAGSIPKANAKRRREFAIGRALARQGLRTLGFADVPLLNGEDRAPVWPAGSVGSISHTDDYCVAVVARCPPYRSLGVDAEPAVPLEESLWPQICTAFELDWLGKQQASERGMLCHLLFVVKECVYKFQAPLSQTFLNFHDVEATFDPTSRTFDAVIRREGVPGFPRDTHLEGRFLVTGALIIAGVH